MNTVTPGLLPSTLLPVARPQSNPSDPHLLPLPQKLKNKILKHGAVPPARPSSRPYANTYPSISQDPLERRLAFLQSQAIADSTRRTYSAGVRRYISFCNSRQWQSFPATESALRYFAADQVSYRTVKLYMASIHFFPIGITSLTHSRMPHYSIYFCGASNVV